MKVTIDADVIGKQDGGVRLRLHTGFGNPELIIHEDFVSIQEEK